MCRDPWIGVPQEETRFGLCVLFAVHLSRRSAVVLGRDMEGGGGGGAMVRVGLLCEGGGISEALGLGFERCVN